MLLSPQKCTLVCQNRSNQSSVRAATRLSVVQHIHAAHQMERNFLKPAHSRTHALFQLVFYSCEWKPPSCLLMALSDKELGGWWEKKERQLARRVCVVQYSWGAVGGPAFMRPFIVRGHQNRRNKRNMLGRRGALEKRVPS